ncbi:IclR family transcriptional regulator [Tsukamurella soli]|uniref:IclR family transcriptional regulator n=1 Tax=Tsukamurella soli TaxID=644556 RepID=A0ABP8JPP4_9ACTN
MTEPDGGRAPAPAVTRALGILGLLADNEGQPMTLSEIARGLSIAKSSCANLCQALEEGDMIRRVSEGFALGHRTAEIGGSYALQFNQVREFFGVVAASPTLHRELVQVAMLDGTDALYLARHEGRAPYRFGTPLGSRLPAVFTATGNALLAALPAAELDALLAATLPARSVVDGTELGAEALRAQLADDRVRGYAVDPGRGTPGLTGIAVSIPAWTPGDPPLAMGAAIRSDQADPVRVAEIGIALVEAAARLRNPWLSGGTDG